MVRLQKKSIHEVQILCGLMGTVENDIQCLTLPITLRQKIHYETVKKYLNQDLRKITNMIFLHWQKNKEQGL